MPLDEVRGLHAECADADRIRRDELHSMAAVQRQYSAVDEQQLNDAARVEVVDQELRELGDREDEDQIEAELKGGDGSGGEIVYGGESCVRAASGKDLRLDFGRSDSSLLGLAKSWYDTLRIARRAQDGR